MNEEEVGHGIVVVNVSKKQMISLEFHAAFNTDVIVVEALASLREVTEDVNHMSMLSETWGAEQT